MSLEELGLKFQGDLMNVEMPASDVMGRVIAEHRERYRVQLEDATVHAEITGNLRYSASGREDYPAVGDWLRITPMGEDFGIIHEIYPRRTVLKRQAVGTFGEVQIIATNIDYAMIVQAVDQDFNLKRLERYLTICHASGIEPLVILSKIDLVDEETLRQMEDQVRQRVPGVPVISMSSKAQKGFEELSEVMEPYRTYCILGSSGVGKSTLINHLEGKTVMETSEISDSTGKGRHTTTHRQLLALQNKSLMIDTPGMRELGIADASSGVETTFGYIDELVKNCKYRNCSHTEEDGCAVLAALNEGSLEHEAYQNYLKLLRERERFSKTVFEKRRDNKVQGKMYKAIQKERRRKKF